MLISQDKEKIRERVKELAEFFSSSFNSEIFGDEDDTFVESGTVRYLLEDIQSVFFNGTLTGEPSLTLSVDQIFLEKEELLILYQNRIDNVEQIRSEAAEKYKGEWKATDKRVFNKLALTSIWDDKIDAPLPDTLFDIPPPDRLGITLNGEEIEVADDEKWEKACNTARWPRLNWELEYNE